MSLQDWLPAYQKQVNDAIEQFFSTRYGVSVWIENTFESALRYAVEWGGKRLRPILGILAYEYISKYPITKDEIRALVGIEFIHCFTLVHDDLPCMDNDEYRRGKLTVWKEYWEAMAVLVWDTLQSIGFELLARSGKSEIITEIARAIGDLGVARGQVRDTFLANHPLSLDELMRLHDEKTGGFIASSLVVGGLLADAWAEKITLLRKFGFLLGRAFQIRDDILDSEWDSLVMGKKVGKDLEAGKGIIACIGIDQSKKILQNLESEMKEIVAWWGDERFLDVIEYVVRRDR